MEQNKIKTPYELFYIECEKGWEKLYKPIIEWIDEYNLNHDDKIEIIQIKEKWGGLRFYVSFGPKELYDLIDAAEKESYKTCEFCGTNNNIGITTDYWYTTICLDCLQKNLNQKLYIGNSRKWKRREDNKTFVVTKNNIKELKENEK